jgi:hypothetical protein
MGLQANHTAWHVAEPLRELTAQRPLPEDDPALGIHADQLEDSLPGVNSDRDDHVARGPNRSRRSRRTEPVRRGAGAAALAQTCEPGTRSHRIFLEASHGTMPAPSWPASERQELSSRSR